MDLLSVTVPVTLRTMIGCLERVYPVGVGALMNPDELYKVREASLCSETGAFNLAKALAALLVNGVGWSLVFLATMYPWNDFEGAAVRR